jgi:hypothetical protein
MDLGFSWCEMAFLYSLFQVIEDCDIALVLLLNEKAKATALLWESKGAGDGIPSAELKSEELLRVSQANQ